MHYHVPRTRCVPIHDQRKLLHIFPAYVTKIRFNIISYLYIDFPSEFFPWGLSNQKLARMSVSPVFATCSAYLEFHRPYEMFGGVHIMALPMHFFWSVVISSFLGLDIFLSTDFTLTSKMIHVCTNNSVCSWWFAFPSTHKIVLLCWFFYQGCLSRQTVPLNQTCGLLLHLFSMNVAWPSKF